MKLSITHKPSQEKTDTIVVFAWKKKDQNTITYSSHLADIPNNFGDIVTMIASDEGFDASVGKTFIVHTHGTIPARAVMIAGLGSMDALTVASLQKTGASIARRLKDTKSTAASVYIEAFSSIETRLAIQSLAEGLLLGSYQFTSHKTSTPDTNHTVSTCFLVVEKDMESLATEACSLATVIAEAVSFTRDLVNEPPSLTTPTYLAKTAQELVTDKKNMSCEVFGKDDLIRMKMGGLLGIARGTDVEPKFIRLDYNGGGNKTVALIGKGITFDTGGLSLKPANAMETMKMDMAGAAAILGVFHALATLHPDMHVVGLISATENMPGPNAVKPGDVVTAMNGKTIEILNTDAEGRVVLADALSYAVSVVKPDVMIDLATLTGACIVALGEEVTGLFSNSDLLANELLTEAKKSGEMLWHMPLVNEYKEHIKSHIADIKNMGNGRSGGAITAALFLQEFTSESIPWAHLDIAGPAFAEKDMIISPYGGTGHGVRLLLSYLLKRG